LNHNLRAFLAVIRACEGTVGDEGYRALFGWRPGNGKVFDSFADHPRKRIPYGDTYTTAAGAYQMLASTYDDAKAHTGVADFSPESQDRCAVYLIQRRGALDDVNAGRLRAAISKTNREWASLPGSPYGQPVRSLDFCERTFATHGGTQIDGNTTYKPEPTSVPLTVQPVPIGTPPKEPRMGAALLAGLLPSILSLFSGRAQAAISKATGASPDVAQKFTEDIARQIQTVSGVTVTDAASAMEAAGEIAKDPAKVAALEAHATGFVLTEIGGGVTGAREEYAAIAKDFDDDPAWRILAKFLANPIHWVTGVFLWFIQQFIPHLAAKTADLDEAAAMGLIVLVFAVIGVVSARWMGVYPKQKE
jgi:muramidase (phage lysozyme)